MEDRDRTYHTIWFVLVIVALAAWNVHQFRQANTERGELRARISELVSESESATEEARTATADLAEREERFRAMSFACARVINELEREAWSQANAIGEVFQGWTLTDLQEWADGEAQAQAYSGQLESEDRVGCGMRFTNPNDLRGPREVEPVKHAWVEGAAPVEG